MKLIIYSLNNSLRSNLSNDVVASHILFFNSFWASVSVLFPQHKIYGHMINYKQEVANGCYYNTIVSTAKNSITNTNMGNEKATRKRKRMVWMGMNTSLKTCLENKRETCKRSTEFKSSRHFPHSANATKII